MAIGFPQKDAPSSAVYEVEKQVMSDNDLLREKRRYHKDGEPIQRQRTAWRRVVRRDSLIISGIGWHSSGTNICRSKIPAASRHTSRSHKDQISPWTCLDLMNIFGYLLRLMNFDNILWDRATEQRNDPLWYVTDAKFMLRKLITLIADMNACMLSAKC